MEEEEFDRPVQVSALVQVLCFGATGGVMEAALRTAYYVLNGENWGQPDLFKTVRGMDGIREAEVEIAGIKIRAAIVSRTWKYKKADRENSLPVKREYHFVEGDGVSGWLCRRRWSSQSTDGVELADVRGRNLYQSG